MMIEVRISEEVIKRRSRRRRKKPRGGEKPSGERRRRIKLHPVQVFDYFASFEAATKSIVFLFPLLYLVLIIAIIILGIIK